jgi:hypothetical protein
MVELGSLTLIATLTWRRWLLPLQLPLTAQPATLSQRRAHACLMRMFHRTTCYHPMFDMRVPTNVFFVPDSLQLAVCCTAILKIVQVPMYPKIIMCVCLSHCSRQRCVHVVLPIPVKDVVAMAWLLAEGCRLQFMVESELLGLCLGPFACVGILL